MLMSHNCHSTGGECVVYDGVSQTNEGCNCRPQDPKQENPARECVDTSIAHFGEMASSKCWRQKVDIGAKSMSRPCGCGSGATKGKC